MIGKSAPAFSRIRSITRLRDEARVLFNEASTIDAGLFDLRFLPDPAGTEGEWLNLTEARRAIERGAGILEEGVAAFDGLAQSYRAGDGAAVSVLGDVGAQGVYPIERPTLKLTGMLARAGGVQAQRRHAARQQVAQVWRQAIAYIDRVVGGVFDLNRVAAGRQRDPPRQGPLRGTKLDARVVDHMGRTSLEGAAILADAAFSDGVIEVDIAVSGARSYPGIIFRRQSPTDLERFYVRPHRAGLYPDAVQYAPVVNGISEWQLYNGPGYTNGGVLPEGEWNSKAPSAPINALMPVLVERTVGRPNSSERMRAISRC